MQITNKNLNGFKFSFQDSPQDHQETPKFPSIEFDQNEIPIKRNKNVKHFMLLDEEIDKKMIKSSKKKIKLKDSKFEQKKEKCLNSGIKQKKTSSLGKNLRNIEIIRSFRKKPKKIIQIEELSVAKKELLKSSFRSASSKKHKNLSLNDFQFNEFSHIQLQSPKSVRSLKFQMKSGKKIEQKQGYLLDTSVFPVTTKSKLGENSLFKHKNIKEQKMKYRNILNKMGKKHDLFQLTDKINKFQSQYIQ